MELQMALWDACPHTLCFPVQLLSHVQVFATPWTTAHHSSLFVTNFQSLLKLMSINSVMPSNHLTLHCPLLLLPSTFPASGSFPMSQFWEVSYASQAPEFSSFPASHPQTACAAAPYLSPSSCLCPVKQWKDHGLRDPTDLR